MKSIDGACLSMAHQALVDEGKLREFSLFYPPTSAIQQTSSSATRVNFFQGFGIFMHEKKYV